MLARSFVVALAPLFALSIAAAPSTAFAADEVGKPGIASKVEILTPSADGYLQFHGRLIISVTSSLTEEYRWGGTSCGSKTLSAENVHELGAAVREGLQVSPRYQSGQGSTRCLVGFAIQKSK
jgi:hypothetical protein